MATKTTSKKNTSGKKATASAAKLKGAKARIVRAMDKGFDSIGDIAREVDCSTTYARKTLFAWADDGLVELLTNDEETRTFVQITTKGKKELRA